MDWRAWYHDGLPRSDLDDEKFRCWFDEAFRTETYKFTHDEAMRMQRLVWLDNNGADDPETDRVWIDEVVLPALNGNPRCLDYLYK